jgi:peptidyl-prolyl cis-trans isomerase C
MKIADMYQKPTFVILSVLAFSLSLGGCKKKQQVERPPEDLIARVDEEILTEWDLEMDVPEAQRAAMTPDQKRDYVKLWIESEILYQEAKRKNIDQDETTRWRMDRAVRNAIIESFLQKELAARVKVSEDEINQYYQKNKNMFTREEEEVRLSHILVRNVAEAGLVRVRMEGGESFDMIAKQLSLDAATKDKAGDMGYFVLSNLPAQFYEEVAKLEPGKISAPIQTDYGLDIVMLTERKEKGSIREYELVKSQISNTLIVAKRKAELANLLEELKKEANITTFGWASGLFPQEER